MLEKVVDNTFLPSLMEMGYNTPATITLVQHLSWECPERSRWIINHVLVNLDRNPPHKQYNFSDILIALLSIPDSIQQS